MKKNVNFVYVLGKLKHKMKIILILTGKTNQEWIQKGSSEYLQRILRYINFEIVTITQIKQKANMPQNIVKDNEAVKQLKYIKDDDYVVLLDENGKKLDSKGFSDVLQKRMLSGNKRLLFVIGGAYGFGKSIIDRADSKLSLSSMTFSHQIVRVIFLEQLYRAFTIINNEPYHHGN